MRIPRAVFGRYARLLGLVLLALGGAALCSAYPITWKINGTFSDGGTVTGTFVYDPDLGPNRVFSSFNVSVSGGNTSVFFPFNFTPANSNGEGPFPNNDNAFEFSSNATYTNAGFVTPENYIVSIVPASPLTDAGGTVNINLTDPHSNNCFDCDPYRTFVSGTIMAVPSVPIVPADGVVDGAGFSAKISGGGLGSIFGTNLAAEATAASGLPLLTTLGGTIVTMNGIAVPLLFVSPLQINFQVPFELLTAQTATLTVTTALGASPPITVDLSPAAPGIFVIDTANSATQGAIQIANTTTLVAPVGAIPDATSRPAMAGDYLTIYCSGLGGVTNTPADGAAAGSGDTLSYVQGQVSVIIGGQSAPFLFAGLTPGFVGLYQVNVQMPAGVTPGNAVPVTVSAASLDSNTATIAVQ